MLRVSLFAIILASISAGIDWANAAEPIERRWVYLQMNLQVRENVDRAAPLDEPPLGLVIVKSGRHPERRQRGGGRTELVGHSLPRLEARAPEDD